MEQCDLIRQTEAIAESIGSGHQVIIIAHSQGNFFINKIHEKIELEFNSPWATQYIKTIAIASFANSKPTDQTPVIMYDNDFVSIIPGIVGDEMINPLRYYSILPQSGDNSYDGKTLPCVAGKYFPENEDIRDCAERYNLIIADVNSFDFHLFSHYMSPVLSVSDHYGFNLIQKENPSYKKIMEFLSNSIKAFRTAPSQWEVEKSENNCASGCENKLTTVKHKYSQSLSELFSDDTNKVYPFDKDGKLYPAGFSLTPVLSAMYAKSKNLNGERIEEYSEGDICCKLFDAGDHEIAKINSTQSNITEPKNGFVEVSLSWEDISIDMDLKVDFTGFHDIKDECEPFEHFYSPNTNYGFIPEGLYPVYIRYAAGENATLNQTVKEMQNIVVTIKVPGSTEARTVNLKTIDSLANGHIADIKVEERKVEVVLKDEFQRSSTVLYNRPENGYTVDGGGSGKTYGGYSGGYEGKGSGSGSGGWSYTYSGPPVTKDYIYSIIWHISQALLGPLAGANITIYELGDYNLETNRGSNPIYSDTSSYGSSIYTAGVINIPREIMDSLDDEKLYIVEAKGGMDIDANDDKVFDASPVINVGSVRALSSGSMLKNIGFKVNILTEAAYQISKKHYNAADLSRLINKSDEAVKCLLSSDINLDNVTNSIDALYFTPYSDMDKLYRNYRGEFLPVINKLHKGEDIYEDIFKLYARPLVKGGYFSVNEDAPIGTVIGKIETDCVSESPVHLFNLSGAGAENFEVDAEGNIKVAKRLVYEERRIYSLSVTGVNSYGSSPASAVYITVTADNSPVITSALINYVFENMPNGSYLGTISVNDMGYQVSGMRLEGYGAEYFNIDNEGRITVAHGENISVQDREYNLLVTASNAFGQSAPSSVRFTIYDDTPVILNDIYVTIREDIAKGAVIGKPSFYHGLSNIKEFTLEGYGAENFNVSADGTISISQNADIKLENSPYRLSIYAQNEQGRSASRVVTVNVMPIPVEVIDHNISLYDFSANIYVSANNNSVIGKIAYSYGYTPPSAFTLSGERSGKFSISSNGIITLIDNANLNAGDIFNLEANASNEYASSGKSQVKITVIDDTPYLYNLSVSIMEGLDAGTAIGKVGYSYGVLPVVSFELEGADAVYFTIDENGVIRIKEGTLINYDVKSLYTFTVKGVNSIGKAAQSSASVRVINDAPVISGGTFSIMENSYGGEYVGRVGVVSNGKSVIESFTLSGAGAEHFTIDKNGDIKTAIGAAIDYETKSVYNLKATAQNAYDTSNEASVTINVVNAPDQEPVLIPTTLNIDENSPNGTHAGNMGIYAHGHSIITSFAITGTNSDWFSIDSGKITVTDLAKLDYESKKIFNFKVKAISAYGESTLTDLTINVNNVPDLPPTVTISSNFYIDENSPAGTFVGQLNINDDGSPVTSVVLSGTGTENFKVHNNGTIVVAEGANLDYESKWYYNLSAKAINALGESNTVYFSIYLNNIKDTPPVPQDIHLSIHKRTPANKTIGAIAVSATMPCDITGYVSDDSSVFGVRDNGEVYTNTAISEGRDYIATINVYAKSSCGDSDTVKLTVDTQNRIIGSVDISKYPYNTIRYITLSSDNTKAFVGGEDGFMVVDIRDPAKPVIISSVGMPTVKSIILSADETKAFVVDWIQGLKIFDIGDPAKPVIIGKANTYRAFDIALSLDETKAFIAAAGTDYPLNYFSLNIVDISNPAKPALITSMPKSAIEVVALSSDNTKLFINDRNNLQIMDVSNITEPVIIGSIGMSEYITAITLSSDGTKAFVSVGYGSSSIIDVSDPAKPALIGKFDIYFAYDIVLSLDETKAFVADYYSGLKIFDISDLVNPIHIGSVDTIYATYAVTLSSDETKAFVGANDRGLMIIDIEDFTKK